MNLYLIRQTANKGYDVYDSAVVIAIDEFAARYIHPGGGVFSDTDWADSFDVVEVVFLGAASVQAIKHAKNGIICASFNAG